MKIAAFLLLLVGSPLTAQTIVLGTPEHPELMTVVHQFYGSIRAGDRVAYADVFCEDFVFTWSGDGAVWSPESILPNVVPTPDHTVLIDEVVTRIRGDAAILNYRARDSERVAGVRVTFSLVHQDGDWKAMSYQSTTIPEPEGAPGR